MDAGYCVGKLTTSDYVSFSRGYQKNGREPLQFAVENLDNVDQQPCCYYGRSFFRVVASGDGVDSNEQESSSPSSNSLLDRVNELKIATDSVTYKDIKAHVVEEFGQAAFEENKELVKLFLEYRQLKTSKGLLYRTQDGFIKICTSKYFGGLPMDQFIFFVLDEEHMGYGEQIQHEDIVRILYVDKTTRAAWNLEQRLYMGGVGDGVKCFYMTTNVPDDTANFVVQDVDYKSNTNARIVKTENELNDLKRMYSNAQELIQLLRENNGEAESEVQKEHKHNEYMKAELVHKDEAYRAQLHEKNEEIKLLKAQKKLLKNECRRLLECQSQSEERIQEMLAMKDIDMAEMETLRKQLAHQSQSVTANATKDHDESKSHEEIAGPIKSSSFVSSPADSSSSDDESSSSFAATTSASAKQTKKEKEEKKARRRRSLKNAGEVLNLQSKVSFLSAEVKDLGRENAALKREIAENDLMVKDLGGKLHLLVVENEKMKSETSSR